MKPFFILLFLFPLAVFAQGFDYTIKGEFPAITGPAKVFLSYTYLSKNKVDSVWMKNGHFEFKGSAEKPVYARILIDRLGKGIYKVDPGFKRTIYIEPGTIMLASPDSLSHAQIKGGPLNEENNELIAILRPAREIMDSIYTHKGKTNESIEAKKNYDLAGLEFIKKHPSSPLSLGFLQTYGGPGADYNTIAPIFNGLAAAIKNSEEGKAFAYKLDQKRHISIGENALDFAQADTAGRLVHLHDYKGKYVLIDFWASWCGPCRKENPNLVAAYGRCHSRGFNILGISLDKENGRAAWLKAIHSDGLTWTQVSDLKFWDNAVARLYNVQGVPSNFLIDRAGRIIAKNLRGDDLDKKLEEVFGK